MFLGGFVELYGDQKDALDAVKLLGFESPAHLRQYLNQLLGILPVEEDLLKKAASNLLADPGKLKNFPFPLTEAELLSILN